MILAYVLLVYNFIFEEYDFTSDDLQDIGSIVEVAYWNYEQNGTP